MIRIPLAATALAVALLALAAACGGGPQVASPTVTPTATQAVAQTKLFFLRPQSSTFQGKNALWMSNLDGTQEEQVSLSGVAVFYAGFARAAESGGPVIYYEIVADETERDLWSVDLQSGTHSAILSFDSGSGFGASASVRSDGRYVAYSTAEGFSLLNLLSGERRQILSGGDREACRAGAIGECIYYYSPAWSPDGTLLTVGKGFYEGSTAVVVDPFSDPPSELNESSLGDTQPSVATWSPSSKAVCAFGQYGETSGLYLAEAPSWQYRNVLPEYEVTPPGEPYRERSVTGCGWLDEDHALFSASGSGFAPSTSKLFEYDVARGTIREVVALTDDESFFSRSLFVAPDGKTAVTQFHDSSTEPPEAAQPTLVDTQTGALKPILQQGDWVVGVVEMPTP